MNGRDLARRAYGSLVRGLAGIAPDPPWRAARRAAAARDGERIGYYLWQFPFPSETFIRREMRAIRDSGVHLVIVADEPGEPVELDDADRALVESATYLRPALGGGATVAWWALRFLARRPRVTARLFLFVLGARYEAEKSLASDLALFARAIRVANAMRAAGVTHLHSPWANINALVALVASRLLGLEYSVHGRAHDLHRDDTAFALAEKFAAARFVVTNTRYNLEGIRSLLPDESRDKVHLIRNGLDLAEYRRGRAPGAARRPGDRARVLCVARLIEPKGLTVLLEACRHLRDRGVLFSCEIIGGPEEPLYTGYRVKLGVLHHRLHLEDVVTFRGAQPSRVVREAYQRADTFVLPCVVAANGSKDITPNSLLEAMAVGLPVISTWITAIPEIVTDGESGLLVAPGDALALADAMERLAGDPGLCERLGANAREAVESRFDIHRNMMEYARLFRSLSPS